MTGAFVQAYGPEHAEGALHFFEGWVVFLMCLLALLAVVALFAFFSKPRRNAFDALGAPELKAITPRTQNGPRSLHLGLAAASAVAVIGLSQVVTTDSLIIPERQDFAGIPERIS